MVPFRVWLTTAFVSGVILGSLLSAQVDDEKNRPPKQDESEQIEAHSSPSPKPKKSPTPVAKASKDKSGKKHKASATAEKVPTAIPHAKLANDKSQNKTDASPKEKKSPTPVPKAKAAKEESTSDDSESPDAQESPHARKAKPKSDDEEEATPEPTPRETPERSPEIKAASHAYTQTEIREEKSQGSFKQNEEGGEIRIDAKRRGNTKTGKDAAARVQKSALQDQSGQHQPRKVSSLRRRRQRPLLSQKLRVLVQPASELRL